MYFSTNKGFKHLQSWCTFKRKVIASIFKVNNEVYKFSKQMNEKVVRILDRYELDKPILMQDKLDMIWDKSKTDKMNTSLMETDGSLSRRQSLMA